MSLKVCDISFTQNGEVSFSFNWVEEICVSLMIFRKNVKMQKLCNLLWWKMQQTQKYFSLYYRISSLFYMLQENKTTYKGILNC